MNQNLVTQLGSALQALITPALIVLGAIAVVVAIRFLASRYKKIPPNMSASLRPKYSTLTHGRRQQDARLPHRRGGGSL